jgi:hypothetical protein
MVKKFLYGLACSAFALASLGSATVLAPGGSGAASGFSNAGWTLLASTGPQALSSGTFTANAIAWVYSDTSNSFCSGCLDFVYQVTRTGGSDPVERITGGSFAGFSTDVGFVTGSPGSTPGTVDRSSNGSVVGFNYLGVNSLMDGQGTQLLVVETNTKTYTTSGMSVQDFQAANGLAFQPTSVPEPISMSLLGGGLALVGLARWRRKKR